MMKNTPIPILPRPPDPEDDEEEESDEDDEDLIPPPLPPPSEHPSEESSGTETTKTKTKTTPEEAYFAQAVAAHATAAAAASAISNEDVKCLPPPPKAIPTNARPHYYALQKSKAKKIEVLGRLSYTRMKTEEAKQHYEALCAKLAEQESEMAEVESEIADKADAFFEARLEEDCEWNRMYKQLRAYREEHGDVFVEREENPDLKGLKLWVKRQRETWKRGNIRPFREAALNKLEFPWAPRDDLWNMKYKQLLAYKETHGHVLVGKDEYPDLAEWVRRQQNNLTKRYKLNHNTPMITAEREKMLLDVGLKPKYIVEMRWEVNYDMAVKYKAEHGKFPATTNALGSWVTRQRKEFQKHREGKKCNLSPERIEKLRVLDLEDEPGRVDIWKERFDQLVAYKNEHGHFPPIKNSKARNRLGSWISAQRTNYKALKEGKSSPLTEEKIEMLTGIGFQWSVGFTLEERKTWQERYEELVAYYLENGHTRVPISDREHHTLADWVKRQRRVYCKLKDGKLKTCHLTPERISMLEAIGFQWRIRNRRSDANQLPKDDDDDDHNREQKGDYEDEQMIES